MKAKRALKTLAARAAVAVAHATGDDDSQLAQLAYKTADAYGKNTTGESYESIAARIKKQEGYR